MDSLKHLALVLVAVAPAACGDDDPSGPTPPPPRVIPGGGIGDGPIEGVANVYVIDDATRAPIAGAQVRVGEVNGATDADGLFVAEGVVGAQTVVAVAPTYRAEMWVGANGANLTFNLARKDLPAPPSGTITGTITGYADLTVPQGHIKQAIVLYGQTRDLGDPANQLVQANRPGEDLPQNACLTLAPAAACTFTVTARTGTTRLIAAIFDRDLNGTLEDPSDDVVTLIRWAVSPDLTVTSGGTHTQDVALVPTASQHTLTVDFGSAPAALDQLLAVVGIEVGDQVLQLPTLLVKPPAADQVTLVAPALDAVAGARSYRLTGIGSSTRSAGEQSVVLRLDQPGPSLDAGAWLAAPAEPEVTTTGASWIPAAGATVHGVEVRTGSSRNLNVTVLDATAAITFPTDLVPIPTGAEATVQAIGAPGLDVTDFALDEDRDKLVQVGARVVDIR